MLNQSLNTVRLFGRLHTKDIDLLEKVQRRFTKRLPGFKHLSYLEGLAKLNLKTLEARRLLIDLCLYYKIVKGLGNINLSDMLALQLIVAAQEVTHSS
jgi:ribonuclease P/MRP protein subunit RPP40